MNNNCKKLTELYKYLTKERDCKKKKNYNNNDNNRKVIPCINNLIDNSNRLTDHKISNFGLIMKNLLLHNNNNHNHNNICTYDVPGRYTKTFNKDHTVLLQMMGGGGSGGVSYVHNEIIIYAGGGGSGEYYSQYIKIKRNNYWIINIGASDTDTTLAIYDNNNTSSNTLLLTITASAGSRGICITPSIINKDKEKGNMRFKELICGGVCRNPSGSGFDGCIAVPSITGNTGAGGQILGITGLGGLGGNSEHPNGYNGFYGSGGGGAMPNSIPGLGGSGYLIYKIFD